MPLQDKVSLGDGSVQERIRRHMGELRARAQLSGNFLKPANTQVGRWGVLLSYGTATQMAALEDNEQKERAARGMPKFVRQGPSRARWHLSVRCLVVEGMEEVDFEELGMIVMAAGCPSSAAQQPMSTARSGDLDNKTFHFQWKD